MPVCETTCVRVAPHARGSGGRLLQPMCRVRQEEVVNLYRLLTCVARPTCNSCSTINTQHDLQLSMCDLVSNVCVCVCEKPCHRVEP